MQDLAIYPFYTYKFASANPKLSDPPSPTPLPSGNHSLFSPSVSLFLFCR